MEPAASRFLPLPPLTPSRAGARVARMEGGDPPQVPGIYLLWPIYIREPWAFHLPGPSSPSLCPFVPHPLLSDQTRLCQRSPGLYSAATGVLGGVNLCPLLSLTPSLCHPRVPFGSCL